ncbi:Ku protein [Novosphingobium flavum]|uniref:Non-homologous end joining protein Ku n=1 Tax=Novosphingobium flavum TaxID=1778672 RepID=A0A7X1FVC5_9SPHN|nr:Ku protein [Novosphingobium flavum]MBC2667042.1 Ku protein [Novosphingobium flavum]
MAARAYWSGQIRLALVSIPVEIYPATRSAGRIGFNMIHEPSGQRVRYEKVVPGIGPVDTDEIVRGFAVTKNDYVLLDEDEIEAAKVESKRTLDLVQFVEADEIDVLYFEKPYFVVPADELAEEAYVVLRDALKAARKVGLGQIAVRGQEHLVALKPCGRGMVLETLRYADEVQKAHGFFAEIGPDKPQKDLLDLATSLIEQKSGKFEPGKFHDRYQEALQRLIAKKSKARGKRVIEERSASAPKAGNVIDLMAALKGSLGEKGGSAKTPAKRKRA